MMIVLGQRGSKVVDIVNKYPVFAALCLASAIGVLLFGLAGVAKVIPLDPLVLANWVILIWNGVHLGVAFLVVGVLLQYSKEVLRVGRSLLKRRKTSL